MIFAGLFDPMRSAKIEYGCRRSGRLWELAWTAGILLCLSTGRLRGQVPQLLNYQGRVVVGGTNFNGTGQFEFALVNTNGSVTYWSNDGTSSAGSEPSSAVSLNVSGGLYSLALGDTTLTNMAALPYTVFNNSDVRLRVWFNDGTHGWQQLAPDQRIAAVGYAMVSASAAQSGMAAYAAYAATSGAAAASGTNGLVVNSASSSGTFSVTGTGSASVPTWNGFPIASGTATALAPVLRQSGSNVEYVMVGGNDATAVRGDVGHPFATGTAALGMAQAGDTIQFGPGSFNGFLNTSQSDIWVRGSGPGFFVSGPGGETIVGGTIFHGEVGTLVASGTVSGIRYSDFAVDDGAATMGPAPDNCFVISGNYNPAWGAFPVQNYRVDNININEQPGQEGVYLSTGSDGVFNNIEWHGGAQAFVVKSCYNKFTNLTSKNCGAAIVIKQDSLVGNYNASHNSFTNLFMTSTDGDGVDMDEFEADNAVPLCDETFTNVHSSCTGRTGLSITMTGTANPVTGIEVSNWISTGEYSFDNVQVASGTATQPVYVHISNCTSNNATYAGFQVMGPWRLTNCSCNSSFFGYWLYCTAPDTYATFSNDQAVNCAYPVVLASPGVYLWRGEQLLVSGTYNTLVGSNSGTWAYLVGYPNLFDSPVLSGVTVGNTTAQTSLWNGNIAVQGYLSGLPLIPQTCWNNKLVFDTYGTFTTGPGANTMTFMPYVAGGHPSPAADITATVSGASSGLWDLITTYSRTTPGQSSGSIYAVLTINGVPQGASESNWPVPATGDLTMDEQFYWGASSTNNILVIKGINATAKPLPAGIP